MQKAYNILSKIAKILNLINHIWHAVFFFTLVPIGGIFATNALKKTYAEGRVPSIGSAIFALICALNPFLFGIGFIAAGLTIACAIIGKKLPAPAEEEYVEEIAE